jgi:hypothetical protein
MGKFFKNATSESAFLRLSAGSVTRGGPEPPWGYKGASGPGSRGDRGGREAWPWYVLKTLERVVSSVKEATETVDDMRHVLEDVRLENRTASRVDARQVDDFRAKWLCFHQVLLKPEARAGGSLSTKRGQERLLG